jgi:hypothetical protein
MSGHDDTDGARKTIKSQRRRARQRAEVGGVVTIEEGLAEMNDAGMGVEQ